MSEKVSRVLEPADLERLVASEVGVSRWLSVDQERIDVFADVTEDRQFIHVDPGRAKQEAGMDSTIAHGFLTLSLLSAMALDATPVLKGTRMGINYGFDKVRFLSPVKVGARVRGRFTLASLTEKKPGEVDLVWHVSVEIDGGRRPALTAEWINRMYLATEETFPEEKGT